MRWLRRLFRSFRPEAHDRAVDDELRLHIELETDDLIRRGLAPAEARRQAAIAFGGVEGVRYEARRERRTTWLDALRFDLRHAARSLRRAPSFTAAAAITLAVGVGANTSLLNLVDALMFRPPASIPEPERLVSVQDGRTYLRFLELEKRSTTLTLATYTTSPQNVGIGGIAHDIGTTSASLQCVSTSYFPVLGVRPMLGRAFATGEGVEPHERGVVLAHGLWQRQFGSDARIVGQPLTVGGASFTILGVMPRGFTGPDPRRIDIWLLLTDAPDTCSFTGRSLLGVSGAGSGGSLTTFGRLKDGVRLSRAETQTTSLASSLPAILQPRGLKEQLEPIFVSWRSRLARDATLAVWLFGGSVVLLLISCANFASLVAIRTLARRRETALRLQLGASRLRVLSQFVTEHVLLSLLAGIAAIAIGAGFDQLLVAFFPYDTVLSGDAATRFAVAAGAATIAASVSGLVPAIQASRMKSTALAMSTGVPSATRSRLRTALLVTQVALSFVLVMTCGLFARSVQNTRQDLGIVPDDLFVATIDLRKAGYADADIQPAFDRLVDALRQVPSIQSVSATGGVFLATGLPIRVKPLDGLPGQAASQVRISSISPDYFAAAGTRLLKGRPFNEADTRGSRPVAIIDAELARLKWPDGDALGQCAFNTRHTDPCLQVIGVAESRRASVGVRRSDPELFIPLTQAPASMPPQLILVRARPNSRGVAGVVAQTVRAALPGRIHADVRSFDEMGEVSTRSWRLGRTVFGLFGSIAILLAAVGIYSILSLATRQRYREIGVRMALGARPFDIARQVMRSAFAFVVGGWLLGATLAFIAAGYIQHLLFNVDGFDLASLAAASTALLLAAVAGCLLPAVRAARIAPVEALRHE